MSSRDLQKVFNTGDYTARIASGDLVPFVETWRAARPQANQPPGTRSEMVWYFDRTTLTRVVLVHRYLRPDGTLGGSGRPDPKRLILDNEILYC